ncbi:chaperone protein dnaJ 11, chloroplastic-like [Fagus crenata]
MASTSSLYEVLGIPISASCHEIKAAYRKLARMCHPDVVAMNQKETSANEFMKIHAAYSTLSDPDKRANYDREIYSHRRGPYYGSASTMTSSAGAAAAAAMSGFSGYTRRNWETDQCW